MPSTAIATRNSRLRWLEVIASPRGLRTVIKGGSGGFTTATPDEKVGVRRQQSKARWQTTVLFFQRHLQHLLRQRGGNAAALPAFFEDHRDGVAQMGGVGTGEGDEPGMIGTAPGLDGAGLAADGRAGNAGRDGVPLLHRGNHHLLESRSE